MNDSAAIPKGEEADDKLGDDVSLEPSILYPGHSAVCVRKDGMLVCWNCFELLVDTIDLPMRKKDGSSSVLVRVCRTTKCAGAVQQENRKREGDRNRIVVPGRRE